MPIQDYLSHAAAVAKWKADQQVRLLKSQNLIREIESQIRAQKALLADKTLNLYEQKKITEEELINICFAIAQLHEQIKEQQNLQETIKQEHAPELTTYSSSYPSSVSAVSTETLSGLVCPKCNRPLVGRFCPEHGVEGIPMTQSSEQMQTSTTAVQMMCPQCKKPLSVRFCPEHGLEGVPAK
jgi:ribosomal protein L37AE/L43A